ncbi:MAG: hypothetical protein K5650_08230 [Bacteroidales bacterium]|nr:hypothetical protein [Bacteroidales bacterium]
MKNIRLILVLAACMMLNSCDVVQSVLNQFASVANLANCKFDIQSVSSVNVAGVNLKNISNGNITASDVIKLAAAIQSKNVPLGMNVNIGVDNPTKQSAALTAMDWILEVDRQQMANGVSTKAYTINPGKATTIPLGVNADLYSLFSSKGLEALKNFASSFTNDGISSQVGLKIKPSISVGEVQVPFPNYIALQKSTGKSSTTSSGTSSSTSLGNMQIRR